MTNSNTAFALAAAAFAASMAGEAMSQETNSRWSGCRAGVTAAYAVSGGAVSATPINFEFDNGSSGTYPPAENAAHDLSGFASAGVLAGCDFSLPVFNLVAGIDGEVGYSMLEGSVDNPPPGADDGFMRRTTEMNGVYAMIAPRIGVDLGRAMIYAKAGAAYYSMESRFEKDCTEPGCTAVVLNTTGETSGVAPMFGGGVDVALTDRILLRAEYLHIDSLGSFEITERGYTFKGSGGATDIEDVTFRGDVEADAIQTVRIAASYRF
ncbi:MAG: outer membrane beta-barrel protein [Pseudomonadota bacterium]